MCYNIWPVRSSGCETNITAASFSSRFDDKWGCSLAALLTRLHSHSLHLLFMGLCGVGRIVMQMFCCLREAANTVMLQSSHIKSVSLAFLIIWARINLKAQCVKSSGIHSSPLKHWTKYCTNPIYKVFFFSALRSVFWKIYCWCFVFEFVFCFKITLTF